MKIFNPRILIIYQYEKELKNINAILVEFGIKSITVTDKISVGIKYASENKIDLIICKLNIAKFYTSKKLIKILDPLGIPTIFYTHLKEEYENYNLEAKISDNNLYSIVFNLGQTNDLIDKILNLQKNALKVSNRGVVILKGRQGKPEKLNSEDILFIEAQSTHLKAYTQYGVYTIAVSLTKFLEKISSNFIRVHDKYAININRIIDMNGEELKIDRYTIPFGKTPKYEKQKKIIINRSRQILNTGYFTNLKTINL